MSNTQKSLWWAWIYVGLNAVGLVLNYLVGNTMPEMSMIYLGAVFAMV
jgi:hypothetical protein